MLDEPMELLRKTIADGSRRLERRHKRLLRKMRSIDEPASGEDPWAEDDATTRRSIPMIPAARTSG